jgi:hypothetical protein
MERVISCHFFRSFGFQSVSENAWHKFCCQSHFVHFMGRKPRKPRLRRGATQFSVDWQNLEHHSKRDLQSVCEDLRLNVPRGSRKSRYLNCLKQYRSVYRPWDDPNASRDGWRRANSVKDLPTCIYRFCYDPRMPDEFEIHTLHANRVYEAHPTANLYFLSPRATELLTTWIQQNPDPRRP